MTRNARGDWRDAPVDAKIKPLVDALNATGVVETYASCQGHARRRSDPYVAFRCGVDVAARLDKTLHGLRLGGRLRHWWDISGFFHPEGWELRFYLRAPALTEARDDPARAFWFYVLRRKAIDHDLDLLSRELCGDLGGGGGASRLSGHGDDRQNRRRESQGAKRSLVQGIGCFASGARPLAISSKHVVANTAGFQSRHFSIFSPGNNRINHSTEPTAADVVCSLGPRRIAW